MISQQILDEAYATYVRNGGDMATDDFMKNWSAVDPQRSLVRNAYADQSLRERIVSVFQELGGGEYPTSAISNSINSVVASTFGHNADTASVASTYPEAGWATVAQVRGELVKMEKEGLVKRDGSSNPTVWKLKK